MVQMKGILAKFPPPAKNDMRKTVASLLAALFLMLSNPVSGNAAARTQENTEIDAA
jgi:multisubunit Na+/H+ antiporter MnhG subunit